MVKLYISLLVLTLSMSSALADRGIGSVDPQRVKPVKARRHHGSERFYHDQHPSNYDQNPSESRREYLLDARDTYDDHLEARDLSGSNYNRRDLEELLQRDLDAEELWWWQTALVIFNQEGQSYCHKKRAMELLQSVILGQEYDSNERWDGEYGYLLVGRDDFDDLD